MNGKSLLSSENKSQLKRFVPYFSDGSVIAAIIFCLVFIVYASNASNVFSFITINNLMNSTVTLVVAAVGLTLVILIGGFDLSVGGVVVLSNVIVASYSGSATGADGGSLLLALTLVILTGAIVGAINGFMVAYLGVQSIAVTLATMIMCLGVALVIMPAPGGFVSPVITRGLTATIGGIIPVALVIIILFIIGWYLLKKTPYGVYIYAVGEDEKSAQQVGIPVRNVKFFTYVLAGIIYGLAGVMLSAQTSSGDANQSMLFLMLVFGAVAIGGTSFGGGKGSVIGSIIGAGILTLLQRTLFAVGVSSFYTSIFQGSILIIAVLIGGLSIYLSKKGDELNEG